MPDYNPCGPCVPLIAVSSLLWWVRRCRLRFPQQFSSILGGKGFNLLNKFCLLLLIELRRRRRAGGNRRSNFYEEILLPCRRTDAEQPRRLTAAEGQCANCGAKRR